MYSRKKMIILAGVALVMAGTLYLAPVLARPYWYQLTEDGEAAPLYQYSHCFVNGTWTRGVNGALQPPCWDSETGEYVPRYNGTRPDWCPYASGQTGQNAGGLRDMWRNWSSSFQQGWSGYRGSMMQGSSGFRRGGGCSRTG